MHRVIAALLLASPLLAGCAAAPPPVAGFRPAEAPIWSNAVIDMGRLSGDWVQVAAFGAAPLPCGAQALRLAAAPGGLAARGALCGAEGAVPLAGTLAFAGPGRLRPPAGPDWWVIWADTDLRTLAIGTPDGRFGFILERSGRLPPDRLEAARQVFDFNGYRTGLLQVF
jgi:apolipoprotein D and lipocalin family protein